MANSIVKFTTVGGRDTPLPTTKEEETVMLKHEVLQTILALTALTVLAAGLVVLRNKLYRYGNKY